MFELDRCKWVIECSGLVKKSVCDDGGLVDAIIFVTRRKGGLFMHFGE